MSKKAFKNLFANVVNDYNFKKLKKYVNKYNPILIVTGVAIYVLAGKISIHTIDKNKRQSRIIARIPFDTYDNNLNWSETLKWSIPTQITQKTGADNDFPMNFVSGSESNSSEESGELPPF